MPRLELRQPLIFQPIFKERVWGGRRLQTLFGKLLPHAVKIGESWELVDRAEDQSVVANGPLAGRTLHDLWTQHRAEIFGLLPESPRFPLLVKLLDAEDILSLQVHPPADVAGEFHGEPKTEFWYIADATPTAELFVGLRKNSSRGHLEKALQFGGVEDHVHRLHSHAGDAMFLPSGRMHAIGAGNVIVEIQQNSDTTYRIYDWDRRDENGRARELHVAQSLRAINFEDFEPELLPTDRETLVRDPLFRIDKWQLRASRIAAQPGSFAIVGCLTGEIECAGVTIRPGHFLLVPADLEARALQPQAENTTLLRVTVDPQA